MSRPSEGAGLSGTFVPKGLLWVPNPRQRFRAPLSQRGCPALTSDLGTPQGKTMDFVDVTESTARWVQDFRLKAYASPAKLESIDGERRSPRGAGAGFPAGPRSPPRPLALSPEHPGACRRAP